METDVLRVTAAVAGVLMAAGPFFQVRRMLHTRSSRDVSLLYLVLLEVGFAAWLAYGWSVGDLAVIASYGVALAFMTATIGVALRFRRAPRPGAEATTPARSDAAAAEEAAREG